MQVTSESILFLLLFSLHQHVRMTRCRATTVATDALLTPYRTRTCSRPNHSRRSEVRCTRSSSTQRRCYVHFIHERKACHQVAHRLVRSLSAWVRHWWEVSRQRHNPHVSWRRCAQPCLASGDSFCAFIPTRLRSMHSCVHSCLQGCVRLYTCVPAYIRARVVANCKSFCRSSVLPFFYASEGSEFVPALGVCTLTCIISVLTANTHCPQMALATHAVKGVRRRWR
jgi:hypothetical protein